MRRRDFIAVISGVAVTWPLMARAQQPMPVIGFLNVASPEGYALYVAAFREGLKESGYVEGQRRSNIAGRKDNTIGCRRWRPIWCAARFR
jgi:hypothetical protein